MSEARVRDALAAIADEVDRAPDLWERTQRRITARRRQRVGRVVAASTVVLALAVASVAVVTNDDDSAPIVASPEAADVPAEILAVVDGDVVVLSSADGSIVRRLVDGEPGFAAEAASGAGRLAYTEPGDPSMNCTEDPRSLIGPNGRIVTSSGPLVPLVSPDGAYVAYRISECEFTSGVGVTSLTDGANYQIGPIEETSIDGAPFAWTLDSRAMLVSLGGSFEVVSAPDGAERVPVDVPGGTYRAVFVSRTEVAVAYDDTVAIYDIYDGDMRELYEPAGDVSALSYDAESRTLLVAREGAVAVVNVDSGDVSVVEVPGLSSAAWQRAAADASACVGLLGPVGTPLDPDECGGAPTAPAVDEVTVPDVRGLSQSEGVGILEGLGLAVEVERINPYPDATVVDQNPAPGEVVAAGSIVALTVFGDQPDSVPDLTAATLQDAIAMAEAAGLVAETDADASDLDFVFWQEPPPGAALIPGRSVRMWGCPLGADCVSPPPDYVDALEPASTWRVADLAEEPLAAIAGAAYPGADALGAAVAERVRAGFQQDETVTSTAITSADSAEVWVRQRNSPDDSVDGQDYRLQVERRDDGWLLVSGEVREICGRGEGIVEFCV